MSAPDPRLQTEAVRVLAKIAREEMGVDLTPELVARAAGGGVQVGLFTRLKQAAQYVVTGVTGSTWMGPFQPIAPGADAPEQGTIGRQFDFPVGYNTNITPRSNEAVSFPTLRALAESYDLMRLAIETCKDQIESFAWEVVPEDERANPDQYKDEVRRLTDFLTYPDKEHNWDQWLRMFVEDLLVLDAVTVFPQKDRGGDLYSFDLIDSATIKRVIDEYGRTPAAPSPAYQQILKGVPAVNYTRNDLVYIVRNPRTWKLYGYGPVEQTIMTVNIAMRRQVSQLEFYTAGNVPEALVSTPATWTAKQVAQFQLWWDAMLAGNTAQRRRMKFVPNLGDGKIVFPKEAALKDEYDEWLARIICYAFSIAPNALIKQMNRASAEDITESAKTEGQLPRMRFIAAQINAMLRAYLGARGVVFRWKFDKELDPKVKAEVHGIYVDRKVLTPDEVREDLGRAAMSDEQREKAFPTPPAPELLGAAEGKGVPPAAAKEKPTPAGEGGAANGLGKYLGSALALRKVGRKKATPQVTAVAQAVAKAERSAVRAIESVFRSHRAALAERVGREYAKVKPAEGHAPLAKGWEEDLVTQLLKELQLEGVSADLVKALSPRLRTLFAAAGVRALQQVGVGDDRALVQQLDAKAREYVRERGAELVKGLTETSRERLRTTLTEGVEKGWSVDKLKAEVRDSSAFDEDRARVIARTELAKAHVDGNVTGWRESGLVEGKRSILGDLHEQADECDDCVEAGVVPLDEDFEPGLSFPPYHPNCVCDVVPVMADEEEAA